MALKSFIDLPRDSYFPLENLPFGVFKPREGPARIGVALGEDVVDLSVLQHAGLFNDLPPETAAATTRDSLNEFLALGRPACGGRRGKSSRRMPRRPCSARRKAWITSLRWPSWLGRAIR